MQTQKQVEEWIIENIPPHANPEFVRVSRKRALAAMMRDGAKSYFAAAQMFHRALASLGRFDLNGPQRGKTPKQKWIEQMHGKDIRRAARTPIAAVRRLEIKPIFRDHKWALVDTIKAAMVQDDPVRALSDARNECICAMGRKGLTGREADELWHLAARDVGITLKKADDLWHTVSRRVQEEEGYALSWAERAGTQAAQGSTADIFQNFDD